MKKTTIILVILLCLSLLQAMGQCKVENTFFKNGEKLSYDLYFKLGLVNKKAGSLILDVSQGSIKGKGDHKMTFLANTNGIASTFYNVNDTLLAYTTKSVQPVAYIKNALEKDRYTQEEIYYSYKDGKVNLQTKRHRNGEFRFDDTLQSEGCIYDMVSIVYYARTLDYSNMKVGDNAVVNFISGNKMSTMTIHHDGFERIKANDGSKYDCIKLVLSVSEGNFENKKEAMKVYLSNDSNRIPIRLDTSLKVGSTRAMLKTKEGLAN